MVKTNVHFPTDIHLLFDAMRKAIELTAQVCRRQHHTGWRQYQYHLKKIKKSFRQAQSSKQGNGKKPEQKAKRIQEAHQRYLSLCHSTLSRIQQTLKDLTAYTWSVSDWVQTSVIDQFIAHAKRQMDQVERRVLKGEIIPHSEKVFSLFEPHTEWISKGKMGVPVELGVRLCIVEDEHQFLLHHHLMLQQTDDKVAVSIVQETQARYPELTSVSYDRGFYSPENRRQLQSMLKAVALPQKGRLSEEQKRREHEKEFLEAKRKHSAVESAIHALDVHGLDQCPDHGIEGMKRYVALAITARNLQRVGALLQQKEHRLYVLRERRWKLAA